MMGVGEGGGRKMERKEQSKNESNGGREREGAFKESKQGRETVHREKVRVCTECTKYYLCQ